MCAGEASLPSSDRTQDRAPSKSATLSTPPRRKPQPPEPLAWGSPPTGQRCSVARRPPARPAQPARRQTKPRLVQPLIVSKPAPGGALAAARAAMGALLPVEPCYRYWGLDSSSRPSPPQPSMMVLFRSRVQSHSANCPENQRSHHRFQDRHTSLEKFGRPSLNSP